MGADWTVQGQWTGEIISFRNGRRPERVVGVTGKLDGNTRMGAEGHVREIFFKDGSRQQVELRVVSCGS